MSDLIQLDTEQLDDFAAWAHLANATPGVTILDRPEPDLNPPHGANPPPPPTSPGARRTRDLRQLWAPHCDFAMARVVLHGGGKVTVRTTIIDAVRALDACLVAHDYPTRLADTGAYNCRAITGGTEHSLHAFGIALDLNWNDNPYGDELVTDMPGAMVAAITAIRTRSGATVWRWGGDYSGNKDAMHYEIIASPPEIASGIAGHDLDLDELDPFTRVQRLIDSKPFIRLGARGPAVVELWDLLDGCAIDEDGMRSAQPVFGPATDRAVRSFQTSRRLEVDGKVGRGTWGGLIWEAIGRLSG